MFVGREDGSIGQCGGKPDAQRGELPGAANIANTGYRLSQWLIIVAMRLCSAFSFSP